MRFSSSKGERRVFKDKVVDLRSARTARYKDALRKIESDGKCPFCPEGYIHVHQRVLNRYGGWFVVRNRFSYPEARVILLVIKEKHVEKFESLSASDFAGVAVLVNWAINKYQIKGGAFAMRFGDTRYTGATVCHMHGHIIVPKCDSKTKRAKVIQFPVG